MFTHRRNVILVTVAAALVSLALVGGASLGAAATATVVAFLALSAGWTRRVKG